MTAETHPLDAPPRDEGPPSDGRRLRGQRSRQAVLDHAVQVASTHGLEGLTFGSLSAGTGAGKSAIAGLFGAKEQLQLATVARAREVFLDDVVAPARTAAPGLARVWALVARWNAYSRSRTFAGGCFFRAAEAEEGSRPGPVRDAVVAVRREWDAYLGHHVQVAVGQGELAPDTDAPQVVFEVGALLGAANDRSVLLGDDGAYGRALAAVRAVLVARGADPSRLA
ncbi:TetR family transcriptional regulator C-terminal domain-containing protein [Isoptericola aurantiacus]|uniref:TetR family transcriptional regulator C-terminal domain-containing protein n=1 Tax=Isoptericola aurantiacus TaxID=3377839 RepID=UPI00383A08C7